MSILWFIKYDLFKIKCWYYYISIQASITFWKAHVCTTYPSLYNTPNKYISVYYLPGSFEHVFGFMLIASYLTGPISILRSMRELRSRVLNNLSISGSYCGVGPGFKHHQHNSELYSKAFCYLLFTYLILATYMVALYMTRFLM